MALNDFGAENNTASAVIAGLQDGIRRMHAAGIKVVGGTIISSLNATVLLNWGTPVADAKRRATNDFIRHSGLYDSVADMDTATLDPGTGELKPEFVPGSARVAESVDAKRRLHTTEVGLRIFPVPMRVEHAEREKLNSARKLIASRFTWFLGHLPSDEISKYWGSVEILSDPFYAYEEILCAFGDGPGQPSSMSASIEELRAT